MPYLREKGNIDDALEIREYYAARYGKRLKRLIAKNFDERDFTKLPLILRFYMRLYRLLK